MEEELYTKDRAVLIDIVGIVLVSLVAGSVVLVEILVGDWFFAGAFTFSFTFLILILVRYVRVRRTLAGRLTGDTEVQSQAQEVRAELAAMRAEQQQSLELLRDRLNAAQREIDTAVHDKERLMAELREMVPDAPGDASATFLIEQAHEKVAKESKRQAAQTRVAAREASILRTKSEIEEMQKELEAAEALLSESDRRTAELDNQLNDKNRELWNLKAEVQGAQSHARESRLKTMMLTRSHIKKGEHTLRMLEEMLDDYAVRVAEGVVWVAEQDDGRVVGVVVLLPEQDHLLLDNVAVALEAHGKGIGRALVAFAENEGRRRGFAEIRLYTHEKMTENIAIYPRLGYAETHRAPQAGYDRVFMRKRL